MKKSLSNREKKDGYAHDKWVERKKQQNAEKPKQVWDANSNKWNRL